MTKTNAITTPEPAQAFDYEEMQRLAAKSVEYLSGIGPVRDANGRVSEPIEVIRELLLNVMQRILEMPPPPPGPIALEPGETEVTVRRRITRLRMLKTEVDDPVDGPRVLADTLERRADLRRAFLGLRYDMSTARGLLFWEALRAAGGRAKERIAQFHAAKQLPEAHDPDNPLSEAVRSMHRFRKALHGRPEKRKRKERKRPRRR